MKITTRLDSMNVKPKVSLVGAGPGDPDLISVKGARTLAEADVVLYDALVHPELLNYAPEKAKKVFVGKRASNHRYTQDEINQMLVQNAFNHGHVVRLKGGDPFVFGRGHEELKYVQAFGIETLVIPGISSIASVPALQEIPLTKRGVNESFWVITGTTSEGILSRDVALAARSSATVVILMGIRKLSEITALFRKQGRAEAPVAIIQNGSLPDEKVVLGRIDTIVEKAESEKISAPAIIVIGEVVTLHPDLNYQFIEKSASALKSISHERPQ